MKNQTVERQYDTEKAVADSSQPANKSITAKPYRSKNWFLLAIQFLGRWRLLRRKRNVLDSLSESQLRDIGLSHRHTDHHYQHYENKVRTQWPK